MENILPRKAMITRWIFILLAISIMGCNRWPTHAMFTPSNVPSDPEKIDAWTASLLEVDVINAKRIVAERLKSHDPVLLPLVERMAEYVPLQVTFSFGRGHVRCVRQYIDPQTYSIQYDALYIVQPPTEEVIQERIAFFDESLRSTMSEFWSRFAGSGEDIDGAAGQFAYDRWPRAKEFGYSEESSLGDWGEATLLYLSRNGDAVFIKPDGATAWRVIETDETIPIAANFPEFVKLYADFRSTHEIFDSWAYRKFKKEKTNR